MSLLDNPFSNPNTANQYALPISTFGTPKPTVIKFGETQVITNKPIVTSGLPTGNIKRTISQEELDFNARMKGLKPLEKYSTSEKDNMKDENKANWWSKKTKTQKGLIMGGGVIAIGLISFLIYKSVKK